jgi:hypothetical protein
VGQALYPADLIVQIISKPWRSAPSHSPPRRDWSQRLSRLAPSWPVSDQRKQWSYAPERLEPVMLLPRTLQPCTGYQPTGLERPPIGWSILLERAMASWADYVLGLMRASVSKRVSRRLIHELSISCDMGKRCSQLHRRTSWSAASNERATGAVEWFVSIRAGSRDERSSGRFK